jgi:aspartyl-tRNA(Asn)/glutamyl-tRNA(Gln) amidotransferase subunit C
LPTTHALDVRNAFRADETRASLPQQEALANGPAQNGEAFVVPRVI